ncbi:MAG: YdiU family protein [Verrucomicrobia bacterium]|nr:YdiU family protein [Verrucomicrobiota bacterium]
MTTDDARQPGSPLTTLLETSPHLPCGTPRHSLSGSAETSALHAGWRFDNSYARLPDAFHSRVNPTPVAEPRLVLLNRPLAESLGLDPAALTGPEAAAWFTGNKIPHGAEPIAQAYAGHQYGNLTRLGDGRAILLGEHCTPGGRHFDIQLKGSGPTIYSRRGDGRAALGPMLREYLISEAMHALNIPTTRSLAVAGTGEPVFREEPLPGAVLTRIAASHLRVGTFEYFAARGDIGNLRLLADYTLRRHCPERVESENPALGLLEEVIERQAALLAQWMRVGFVHGVMNTDNMALSGETIDYGPCAFIDAYDPAAVFSSIDHHGRYAFGRQPGIASWNLARFAETLLPILHAEPATAIAQANEALETFSGRFQHHWLAALRAKLGLLTVESEDASLAADLLRWMHEAGADYTSTFRNLRPHGAPGTEASADPGFATWQQRWAARLARQPQPWTEVQRIMITHNPAVIPRNHQVETALVAATIAEDLGPFERLLAALARPYEAADQPDGLLNPPPKGTPVCRTFCGT